MSTDLSKIQAILFDMDGTLIDTDDAVVERLAARLRFILGSRSKRSARWLLMRSEKPGNWLVTVLDRLGLDEQLISFTDKLRRQRGIRPYGEFRLIPGVEDLIPTLSQRYKLGLVTTRGRFHIDLFLDQFPEVAAAFEATCGRQDTNRLKPHPEPIIKAAQLLAVPVDRCLMIGDTTVDIYAAVAAGALAAGVLCGFGQRDELEKAGAHIILESTADLIALL